MMNVDLITKEDFYNLKNELLTEIRSHFKPNEQNIWLKSSEVKELLGCSDSTLQKHRIMGRLPVTKLGGTYYYQKKDIQNLLTKSSIPQGIA